MSQSMPVHPGGQSQVKPLTRSLQMPRIQGPEVHSSISAGKNNKMFSTAIVNGLDPTHFSMN